MFFWFCAGFFISACYSFFRSNGCYLFFDHTDDNAAHQLCLTVQVFELSLPWHVTSAKWTSQGLKLSAG